jgi:hypothetical protein
MPAIDRPARRSARLIAALALAACGSHDNRHVYALIDLPIDRWTAGLPLDGGTLTVDLSQDPEHVADWSRVTGVALLACHDCRLGDDQTAIHDVGPLGGDLAFGHVTIDDATARADFRDGRVHVTGAMHGDVEVQLTVDGKLAARGADTILTGCLAFAPSERLRARDEKLYDAALLLGAPRGADGRYTIAISGTLGSLRMMGQACTP